MNATLPMRMKEAILGGILGREGDVRSPYALYGYPQMWNIAQMGTRTLAVRAKVNQVWNGHAYEDEDGVVAGWHENGRWTEDQHVALSWKMLVSTKIMPALAAGGRLIGSLSFQIEDDDPLEIRAHMLMKRGEAEAEAHSDDRVTEVTFDARPYLATATEKELLELRGIDWRGDYAADAVYHDACAYLDPEALKLELYLSVRPVMPNGDQVGFEVVCDEDVMLAWLQEHRPEMHEAVLSAEFQSRHDVEEWMLDDLVHDHASHDASTVNNGGRAEQEAYLRMSGVDGRAVDEMDGDALGEAVHQAAASVGSEINNGGVEAQLRFLFARGETLESVAADMAKEDPAP